MIKTILRYPGGKTRAISKIKNQLPSNFTEYREPMVGGGSVFLHILQTHPGMKIWINDIYEELYYFWVIIKTDIHRFLSKMEALIDSNPDVEDGKALSRYFKQLDTSKLHPIDRAIRFYYLNRTSFSGLTEAGGFSSSAFKERLNKRNLAKIAQLDGLMNNVYITNFHYDLLLQNSSTDVLTFIDPPYYSAEKLYGKDGKLHSFNHAELRNDLRDCQSKWLITYDNNPYLLNLYQEHSIIPWELQYGMNNVGKDNCPVGKEIFVRNYEI